MASHNHVRAEDGSMLDNIAGAKTACLGIQQADAMARIDQRAADPKQAKRRLRAYAMEAGERMIGGIEQENTQNHLPG